MAAELHDAFQESHGPSPELPLIEGFLGQYQGCSLEIGCGSGRLLLPLRHRGHGMEGLELSPAMAALARERARQRDLELLIHEGDMEHWTPPSPYAALLAPAFTLQLSADPLATLRRWHEWLRPGGGLYLSLFMPYAELTGELPEHTWYDDHQALLPDGRRALLETRHHFEGEDLALVRAHRYRIEGDPRPPYECRQIIRWAEPARWREWLTQAGFQWESQILDWDPQHTDLDPGEEDYDGILTLVARRGLSAN